MPAGWPRSTGARATSPIYQAHAAGLPLHVWVDETRPRNQGASLTAWELAQAGVPHTLIADNAGGHLMQRGAGRSRHRRLRPRQRAAATSATRSAPTSRRWRRTTTACRSTWRCRPRRWTWALADGLREIPIEERSAREVTHISGRDAAGAVVEVQLTPAGTPAANPAFDVTPARLVSGLITEHGVVAAEEGALRRLMEEHR